MEKCIMRWLVSSKFIEHKLNFPRGRPCPRGHILKSLASASKVKSLALASKPQVLDNCTCPRLEDSTIF